METKRIIVTGANSGKGKETTLKLVKLGHEVIMACYSLEKAEEAKREIIQKVPKAKLDIRIVNLDDPESILHFSDQIYNEYDGVDVLVNNAGIYRKQRVLNTIGIDKVFMVNVIGPVMLSLLLYEALKAKAPSRIINLGSIGEKYAYVDFSNLNSQNSYSSNVIYNQSKRALIMLSYKLSELFKPHNISVNSLHPGTLKSDRIEEEFEPTFWEKILESVFKPLTKKSGLGVDTSIYLATATDVEHVTGRYFSNMHISESSRESYDKTTQEQLWDYVISIIGDYLPDTVRAQFAIDTKSDRPNSPDLQ
jgi:NAD(P)-dependent dehydrogenase (short-subunit alcohol dehydrogenase family)